jgi:hypothetical protein
MGMHAEEGKGTIEIGDVLCEDGSIMSLIDYIGEKDAVAAGVVFRVQSNGGIGFTVLPDTPQPTRGTDSGTSYTVWAVLLEEFNDVAFSNSLGRYLGTDRSLTTLNGYENTQILYQNGSPMAEKVINESIFGSQAFIPSAYEYIQIYNKLRDINNSIRILKALHPERLEWQDFHTDEESGLYFYWTSTESDYDPTRQAWVYNMKDGALNSTPKTFVLRCRAAIKLKVGGNDDTSHVGIIENSGDGTTIFYDLRGNIVNGSYRGIVIVRCQDGKYRKTIRK